MSLNAFLRSKILYSDYENDNFDHLKIQCRVQDNLHRPHELFGEELFNIMKSV